MDEQVQTQENGQTSNALTQAYDDFSVKHRAAYAAFKSIYEDKNPQPAYQKPDRSDWYIAIGISVIVIASIIVSGSRTIVEFGGGLVGASAFVMLECAVVAFAFLYTKNNVNEARLDDVRKLTKRGMYLALTVAVVANIHATLKENGVISSDIINTGILLMVAVSAPLLAYISGDIAGLEYMRAASRARKIDEYNEGLRVTYQEGLNRAWAAQQSKWGVRIEVSSPVPAPSNGNSNGNPMENERHILPSASTLGHSKQPMASKIVRDYLVEHPGALEMNPLELAALLNVGKSTVYNVMKEVKSEGNQ